MAKYYMNGYTPPEGVNSASKVKEYQRQLGVKADGIWGPDTDAAYRASLNRSAQRQAQSRSGFDWGDSGRNEAFDGYYNAIRNNLSVPTVTVKAPSAGEVK
ncbi:MAG: peptidoglycan-binding domain-containing protein, partial [Christensenellales bacterium]